MEKSPFLVVKNFITPSFAENIINTLELNYPNEDINGKFLKTTSPNQLVEMRLLPLLDELIPIVEQYYGFKTKGILPFKFEWFVEGFKVEPAKNLSYFYHTAESRWKKISDIDFTGVIFLNDYNDQSPIDTDFEVYGGKLEFPNHAFGFNPQRGTLVLFPECQYFANTTSGITIGELIQIRFHIVPETPYKYSPNNFKGNYTTWFKNVA
jgi:hypothetical protein